MLPQHPLTCFAVWWGKGEVIGGWGGGRGRDAGSRLHVDDQNPANALEYNDVKHHILLTFTHAL